MKAIQFKTVLIQYNKDAPWIPFKLSADHWINVCDPALDVMPADASDPHCINEFIEPELEITLHCGTRQEQVVYDIKVPGVGSLRKRYEEQREAQGGDCK